MRGYARANMGRRWGKSLTGPSRWRRASGSTGILSRPGRGKCRALSRTLRQTSITSQTSITMLS
jgi:hypothetical protein